MQKMSIQDYEKKLLVDEKKLRLASKLTVLTAYFLIATFFLVSTFVGVKHGVIASRESVLPWMYFTMFTSCFLLLVNMVLHSKIRHIDSIHTNRENQKE